MSRYDGLIIPRSYSEYINKTDAATLLQALQLSGVMDAAPTAGSNHPVKSDGLVPADTIEVDNKKAVTSNRVARDLMNGSSWVDYGAFRYKIIGKFCYLRLDASDRSVYFSAGATDMKDSTGNTIYLPAIIRPQKTTQIILYDNSNDNVVHGRIYDTGVIRGWNPPGEDISAVTSWEIDSIYRLD